MSYRYGALYSQTGGCDYTIGCGYRFVELPESIDSISKAKEWLATSEDDESPYYYGNLQLIDLYQIVKIGSFTPQQLAKEFPQEIEEVKEDPEKELRRQQYERLKTEFGM